MIAPPTSLIPPSSPLRSRCWRTRFLLLVSILLTFGGPQCEAQVEAEGRIKSRGILRWGADAEGGAPYVFLDPENPDRLTGFEYELAEALAARLGVRAEMVQNSWDGLVPALERGSFDIILNGLEITEDRQRQIAFTRPYFIYTQQIVVRTDTPNITELIHLRGKSVGVLSASVAQRIIESAGGVDVRVYPGNVESFQDLKNRRIDAVLLDRPIATHYLRSEPDLKAAGPPFAPGYYAIGVRKEDQSLLLPLNRAIGDLLADGTLETIYGRYGLWDENQPQLAEIQESPSGPDAPRISTLRDWTRYLPLLLKGAVVTIQISLLSMGVAIVLGLALALARLSEIPVLRWLAAAYIEAVRGTPLLIQLYLIYYGLPNLGIRLDAFVAGVIGLGLNYAAYEAENYRAGIQAIPRGQREAAMALGMTERQIMRRIIIPQGLRIIIPPMTNDFISLFKDSSLVSVITMVELTKVYGMLATTTYDYIGLGLMTAAIYFALSYPTSLLANRLERRLRHDLR